MQVLDKDKEAELKERLKSYTQPLGTLVALNADNGDVRWTSSDNIYGTLLAVSEKHDVLLMSYQDTRFKLVSEVGGRMAAFKASTGDKLWDVEARYGSRPILNDSTIYAQPGAWDLLTGEKKDFHFDRSYGCGTLAGSKYLLAFRSATLGYRDLLSDEGTVNYGGIRPGCWINTLPAAGLLLMPEASNRCVCSYLIKATIALQPVE
jgi:outer membrane protein assembly factor BamB